MMNERPPSQVSARSLLNRRTMPSSQPPSARAMGSGMPVSSRRASRAELSSRRMRDDFDEASTPRRMHYNASAGVPSSARRMSMRDISNANSKAMKVFIRVRPFSQRELANNAEPYSTIRIDAENPSIITTLDHSCNFRPLKMYSFARCFWSVFDKSSKAENIREAVDAYVNIPLPSMPAERSARQRAQSIVSMSSLPSVRNNTDCSSPGPGESQTYIGAGARAVTMDVNVSHPPYAGQHEVYKHVGKPILDNVIDGFNGCIFAYGQTGSGKTFTMMGYAPSSKSLRKLNGHDAGTGSTTPTTTNGSSLFSRMESGVTVNAMENEEDEEDEVMVDKSTLDPRELQGIIPRICADLFANLRAKQETDDRSSYLVEASYYEVYRERVFDLMAPQNNQYLRIREHPTKGPFVEKLSKKSVMNEDGIARVIKKGIKERHTQATKFNDFSSRSHAILTVMVTVMHLNDDDSWETKTVSKMNLVDLAGSERTGLLGGDIKEDSNINLSLTTLGRVIDMLADISQGKQLGAVPPYRESNLTWLLSDSIGGNSLTSMIATISPHVLNVQETVQTLRYAARAREITLRPTKNEDPQVQQIKALQEQVDRLTIQLKEAGGNNFTETEFLELQKMAKALDRKCTAQDLIVAQLRGELERAGLKDPTLQEGFVEKAIIGASSDARRREEELRRRLDETQQRLATLRAEMDGRSLIEPEMLAELNRKLEKQKRAIASLTAGNARAARATTQLVSYADDIMQMMIKKENALFDSYSDALCVVRASVDSEVLESSRDWQMRLEDALRRNRDALDAERKRSEAQLKDTEERHERAQQQLEKRHQEGLSMVEDCMKRNKELHDQDLQRLARDKEDIQHQLLSEIERERSRHKAEIERLRAQLNNDLDTKFKVDDEIRQLKEAHEKELSVLTNEVDAILHRKDAELARMKAQRDDEILRREAELMEKDRQRRLLELDFADLQSQISKLREEMAHKEKQYKDDTMEFQIRLEQLYRVSNSALGEWENKSSDLEATMCNLRGLIHNKEYMNYLQKIRSLAYTEPEAYDKKLQEIENREKRLQQLVSGVVAANNELKKYIKKAEKDVKENVTIRGMGPNGTPPASPKMTPPPPQAEPQRASQNRTSAHR